MAFEQPFTDACNNHCPNAYWVPAQINIGFIERMATIVFYGYRSAEDYAARHSPLPGAVKTYMVSGQEFLDLYQEHTAPGGPNLSQMVFAYARKKKDMVDPKDSAKSVSFFEEAQEVP
jgi:hypothetical protein